MTTFTKATLILGTDENGNEMGYFQSEGDWYNLQSEMKVTPRFIVNHIYPLVLLVRFGDESMSVHDWKMCGWPVELAEEELAGLRLLNDSKSLEADDTLPGWNKIAEKHAPKPRTLVAFIDCTHPREHPTLNGIHCNDCGTTREPMNGFEKSLVSKLAPRDSGFVDYKPI